MNETEKPAAVKIMFKSSSQPKGQDGYELAVSSDATEADVDRTMLLAARAREQAQAVLAGEYTGASVGDMGTWATLHAAAMSTAGRHDDADCPYCVTDSQGRRDHGLVKAMGPIFSVPGVDIDPKIHEAALEWHDVEPRDV